MMQSQAAHQALKRIKYVYYTYIMRAIV